MKDFHKQLPEYDPHPDLWARIEADLDSDEILSRAITELPQYEPKAGLWDRTADFSPSVIDTNRTEVRGPIVRPLWAGLAAAAVVILIGVWLCWQPSTVGSERIEYAVETGGDWPAASSTTGNRTDAGKQAEEFIRRQCAEQTLACQRPEVHELRNQLTELVSEQQRLENERQTFGDDPALVRAQAKVENQRAEVTKELITLLRS
ncbi:hypothetical protein [Spirosoma utsteinense]|uniref:Anti-sigma factor n=1 Tax=Spirosoma utsteinense TaxID=2585773 RepID=A0ABR6W5G8_9BACT|nr:hypothetical protein [Spirosoma utsteinense]MBC3784733.1 hypothetical protein [Spirosoma utsteinense]MBC3791231.1 hypothetical protein [Spirosoma utsteinense]